MILDTGFWGNGIWLKWDLGGFGFGIMALGNGIWDNGILGKWDFGKMEFWENGILEKWDFENRIFGKLYSIYSKKPTCPSVRLFLEENKLEKRGLRTLEEIRMLGIVKTNLSTNFSIKSMKKT